MLALAPLLMLGACGNGVPETITDDVPVDEVEKFESISGTIARASVSPDESDMLELSSNNRLFETDLYRQQLIEKENENIVLSSFSISNAFAMLYSGSAGETKQELTDVFYFNQSDEIFHQAFNSLTQTLTADESD